MKHESGKINSFTDLNAWKESYKLAVLVYEITKKFPEDEKFGLTNQLRRAVVSISSNVAEGFSRNSYKDKLQFYAVALGSLSEVQSQLFVANGINYLSENDFNELESKSVIVSKLLHGLIKSSKSAIQNS